ncbi:LacI family DNA-binding transcriptional regulator [Deinococcus misasensis]|uniref:LacI family DNA-binding transcriptional regulator n=1 Tax=Deinococcus misasensis TaxID=392413 RepID=UPI00054E8A9C|nr:LacI family DNA-binding transcriptional regulator [Deinococcus misasensis]
MDINIKEVARKAGVSIATVSRVINGKEGYSDLTRQKVMRAIQDLNYKPNALARGLLNQKTQTLAIIFPQVSDMFTGRVLRGVEAAAHQENFSVIVCKTDGSHVRTMRHLELLAEKRVDGIVFASEILVKEYSDFIQRLKIPLVVLSGESDDPGIPCVRCDDQKASFTATSYLIGQGHTQIGMLYGGRKGKLDEITRVVGYHEALSHFHVPFDPHKVITSEGFGFQEGKTGAAQLLDRFPNLTAIFAASDEMAVGVIAAAYERGIRVPEQLSVVGYDDLPIAEMTTPPLTTIHQPLYKMGFKAASMLLDHIHGREDLFSSVVFPHTIIERGSVSRP